MSDDPRPADLAGTQGPQREAKGSLTLDYLERPATAGNIGVQLAQWAATVPIPGGRGQHGKERARAVLAVLVSRARRDPADPQFCQAWPSQRSISLDTGIPVRCVRRAIKRLREAGLIQVEERRTLQNLRSLNVYLVLYPRRLHLVAGVQLSGSGAPEIPERPGKPFRGLSDSPRGRESRFAASPERPGKPFRGLPREAGKAVSRPPNQDKNETDNKASSSLEGKALAFLSSNGVVKREARARAALEPEAVLASGRAWNDAGKPGGTGGLVNFVLERKGVPTVPAYTRPKDYKPTEQAEPPATRAEVDKALSDLFGGNEQRRADVAEMRRRREAKRKRAARI